MANRHSIIGMDCLSSLHIVEGKGQPTEAGIAEEKLLQKMYYFCSSIYS